MTRNYFVSFTCTDEKTRAVSFYNTTVKALDIKSAIDLTYTTIRQRRDKDGITGYCEVIQVILTHNNV